MPGRPLRPRCERGMSGDRSRKARRQPGGPARPGGPPGPSGPAEPGSRGAAPRRGRDDRPVPGPVRRVLRRAAGLLGLAQPEGRRHRPVRRAAQLPHGHQQRRVLERRAAHALLRRHPGHRHDRAGHRAGPVPGQPVLPGPEVLRSGLLPALRRARGDRGDHVGVPARTRPQQRAQHPPRARPGRGADRSAGLPACRCTRSC